MRILLVHNRYRSGAPAERTGSSTRRARHSRPWDTRSCGSAAAATRSSNGAGEEGLASGADHLEPGGLPRPKAVLREHRPEVVHVHNTFPLLSAAVLYACRDAGVPVVATIHNYGLACANGTFFRNGAVCHDCADGLPVRAVLHGCYRESRAATAPVALAMGLHRQAWRSLVSAYIFISASQRDLLGGFDPAPDRVFVRYNLIPRRSGPQMARTPTVVYAGRLDEAKGVRLLMAGWDRYRRKSGEPGLTWPSREAAHSGTRWRRGRRPGPR